MSGAPPHRLDRWVLLAVLAAAAAYAAFALWAPLAQLTFRSTDDSYYYFQVARNVVQGHGVTFDRLHPTNGFHPLWMLLLIPAYAAVHGAGEAGLRLAFVLVAAVAGLTFWVAYRCLAAYAGRGAALAGLVAFTAPPFTNPLLNGLETGILLLFLFLLLWLARRHRLLALAASGRANAGLGALLALVFLARLDSVFVVLGVALTVFVRWLTHAEGRVGAGVLIRKGLQAGGVFALLIAPYFLWNLSQFGHLEPLSGALKSSFPAISFTPRRFGGYHAHYGQALLALATLSLLWLAWRRGRRGAGAAAAAAGEPILLAVWIGCFLHFMNTLLFMSFGVNWWHYSSYAPLALTGATLVLADLAHGLRHPARLTTTAAAGLALFSAAAFYADAHRRADEHEHWLETALWARDHLPPDAVVGMTDCGLFGYFCERRTVNLDGVINGYSYQEALHRRELRRFLAASRMTHVAVNEVRYVNGRHIVWLPARLHREPGGAIVGLESAEVYRSAPYLGTFSVIWDLRPLPVIDDASDPRAIERRVGAVADAGAAGRGAVGSARISTPGGKTSVRAGMEPGGTKTQ